jgi:hypothetical protein
MIKHIRTNERSSLTFTTNIRLDMDVLMYHKIRRVHKFRGICKQTRVPFRPVFPGGCPLFNVPVSQGQFSGLPSVPLYDRVQLSFAPLVRIPHPTASESVCSTDGFVRVLVTIDRAFPWQCWQRCELVACVVKFCESSTASVPLTVRAILPDTI